MYANMQRSAIILRLHHAASILLGVSMKKNIILSLLIFSPVAADASNRLIFMGMGFDSYKYIFNSSWNNSVYDAGDLNSNFFSKGRTDTTKTLVTLNLYYFFDNFGVYTNFNIGVMNVTFSDTNPCTKFFSESECSGVNNNLMRIGSVVEIKLGPAYRLKSFRGSGISLPIELWFSTGLFIQSVGLSKGKLERITGSPVSSQQTVSGYASIELALFNEKLLDAVSGIKTGFTFWASLGFQMNQSSIILPGERNPAKGIQWNIPLRFGIVF